jgi:hypothetical protein
LVLWWRKAFSPTPPSRWPAAVLVSPLVQLQVVVDAMSKRYDRWVFEPRPRDPLRDMVGLAP